MSAVAVDRSEVLVLRVRSAFSHFLCLRQVRCGVNCGVACHILFCVVAGPGLDAHAKAEGRRKILLRGTCKGGRQEEGHAQGRSKVMLREFFMEGSTMSSVRMRRQILYTRKVKVKVKERNVWPWSRSRSKEEEDKPGWLREGLREGRLRRECLCL